MKRSRLVKFGVGVLVLAGFVGAVQLDRWRKMNRPYPDFEVSADGQNAEGGRAYAISITGRNIDTGDNQGLLIIACEGGILRVEMDVGYVNVIGGTMADPYSVYISEHFLPDPLPSSYSGYVRSWSSPGDYAPPRSFDPAEFLQKAIASPWFQAGLPSQETIRFHMTGLPRHLPQLEEACPNSF